MTGGGSDEAPQGFSEAKFPPTPVAVHRPLPPPPGGRPGPPPAFFPRSRGDPHTDDRLSRGLRRPWEWYPGDRAVPRVGLLHRPNRTGGRGRGPEGGPPPAARGRECAGGAGPGRARVPRLVAGRRP